MLVSFFDGYAEDNNETSLYDLYMFCFKYLINNIKNIYSMGSPIKSFNRINTLDFFLTLAVHKIDSLFKVRGFRFRKKSVIY